MQDAISLLELNQRVSRVVESEFQEPVWIVAELASVNWPSNGHCYLELIEKNPKTNATIAKAHAVIWSYRAVLIRDTFESETGQLLRSGIKVMLQVQVSMHPVYGFSLNVLDIEPSFTLGDMQKKRLEIIQRLTEEGMLDVNKSLPLPRLLRSVAIISANTAAGYGDFCHQLEHNDYGLKFYTHLFPAAMQGDQTEKSVIAALNRIYEHCELFDAVVIIRGGGSVVDLNSFDSYELALNIANFPLPVIVGIGHERDNTVLDIVAHSSVKTPTAAAAFLIERLSGELSQIDTLEKGVRDLARTRVDREYLRIAQMLSCVQGGHLRMGKEMNRLALIKDRLTMSVQQRLGQETQKIDFMERSIALSHPDNILRRGYSITRVNGKAVSLADVKVGDILETQTAEGIIRSKVQEASLTN